MLDKTKRYLVVGLGLLGGKYALELTRAGFHVDGINRSEDTCKIGRASCRERV